MPFNRIRACLPISFLLALAGIQFMIIGLPLITEALVKARLPAMPQGFQTDFTVKKIGINQALITDVRIGRDIRVDSIALHYSWGGPRYFQLDRVLVSGAALRAGFDEKTFAVRLNNRIFPVDPPETAGKTPAAGRPDLGPFLPVIPDRVSIRHATLNIALRGREVQLPVRLEARIDPEKGRAGLRGSITPFGQPVALAAEVSLVSGLERFQASGTGILPEVFHRIAEPEPSGFRLEGPLGFHAEKTGSGPLIFSLKGLGISGDGGPGLKLDELSGNVRWETRAGTPVSRFAARGNIVVRDRGISPLPLAVELSGISAAGASPEFSLSASSLPMDRLSVDRGGDASLALDAPGFTATLSGTPQQQHFQARLTGTHIHHAPSFGAVYGGPFKFTAEGTGNLLDPHAETGIGFEADCEGVALDALAASVRAGRVTASGRFGLIRATTGIFEPVSGRVRVLARDIDADQADIRVTASALRLNADLKPGPQQGRGRATVAVTSTVSDLAGVSRDTRFETASLAASGTVPLHPDQPPGLKLTSRITGASLALPGAGVSASGISAVLPVSYPYLPGTPDGQLRVGRFTDGHRLSGRLEAALKQVGNHSVSLVGRAASDDIAGLFLEIDLKAGLDRDLSPEAEMTVRSDAFHCTEESLARVLPESVFNGRFDIKASARGHAVFRNRVLTAGGRISIHDGSIALPDLDLNATGIRGDLVFSDLLQPETLPGQKLRVSAVDAAQFRFEDARFRFSIEDGKSVNLENLTFRWCNGLVSTESLRLPDPDNRVSLTLFCDRLEMDSLLRQIGAFDAQGGGTLSGRIPVVYRDGEISFENGFLFSTPGDSGRIFVRDIDRLMTGMPGDSPQTAYLELTAEALKDFQYKWAKLRLNTTGDVLDVNMELDGKPKNVLPFAYQPELGGFIRVDASSPGSRFQGVTLDVNLELPFNRVIKFGNKLKSILN